jgi:hypothetical protein
MNTSVSAVAFFAAGGLTGCVIDDIGEGKYLTASILVIIAALDIAAGVVYARENRSDAYKEGFIEGTMDAVRQLKRSKYLKKR